MTTYLVEIKGHPTKYGINDTGGTEKLLRTFSKYGNDIIIYAFQNRTKGKHISEFEPKFEYKKSGNRWYAYRLWYDSNRRDIYNESYKYIGCDILDTKTKRWRVGER